MKLFVLVVFLLLLLCSISESEVPKETSLSKLNKVWNGRYIFESTEGKNHGSSLKNESSFFPFSSLLGPVVYPIWCFSKLVVSSVGVLYDVVTNPIGTAVKIATKALTVVITLSSLLLLGTAGLQHLNVDAAFLPEILKRYILLPIKMLDYYMIRLIYFFLLFLSKANSLLCFFGYSSNSIQDFLDKSVKYFATLIEYIEPGYFLSDITLETVKSVANSTVEIAKSAANSAVQVLKVPRIYDTKKEEIDTFIKNDGGKYPVLEQLLPGYKDLQNVKPPSGTLTAPSPIVTTPISELSKGFKSTIDKNEADEDDYIVPIHEEDTDYE